MRSFRHDVDIATATNSGHGESFVAHRDKVCKVVSVAAQLQKNENNSKISATLIIESSKARHGGRVHAV